MPFDIDLMGATYPDVPAIQLPNHAGGLAPFYEHTGEWAALGLNIQKTRLLNKTVKLSDTDYPDITPSTTATAVRAAETVEASVDPANYEYYTRVRTKVSCAWSAGATFKAAQDVYGASYWYTIVRRPYNTTQIAAMDDARQYVLAVASTSNYYQYWNTNGAKTVTTGLSYGVYGVNVAPTLASATAASTTLTISTPTITIRTSSTYFADARWAELDADNTTIQLVIDLFRVDKNCSLSKVCWRDAAWLINNPADSEIEG